MSDEDIERTLRDAFAARAREAVPDIRPVPAPRFASEPARRGHRSRLLAPLAAAAAVIAVVGGILTVAHNTGGDGSDGQLVAGRSGSRAGSSSAVDAPNRATGSRAEAKPVSVHVRLYNADRATYGVGIPVVAIFSNIVTDARPFARATTVTVDGKPLRTSWYFMHSVQGLGAMEAHLRPASFWPAHAKVHVSIGTEGLSAGRGRTYDDSLTLDFNTGARNVATVDDSSHTMTVKSDGRRVRSFPVSLGSDKTPTLAGTKVIMAKDPKVRLRGPGYNEVVDHAQRLTYSGEYLIPAPQNAGNIKVGLDSSNGCTNLLPKDALWLFNTFHVGDVVEYAGMRGPTMSPDDGFGDWNVPWSKWVAGGLLRTS